MKQIFLLSAKYYNILKHVIFLIFMLVILNTFHGRTIFFTILKFISSGIKHIFFLILHLYFDKRPQLQKENDKKISLSKNPQHFRFINKHDLLLLT